MEFIRELLLPYQIEHVESMIKTLRLNKRCLDASDTGTGKTYTAIAAAKILGLKPVVVCPKSVINNWIDVCDIFKVEYYGVSNYELLQNCRTIKRVGTNTIKTKFPYIERFESTDKNGTVVYSYMWKDIPSDMLIIFDEAHRCKNRRTLNSKILKMVAATEATILMLSATVADTPDNFKYFGYLLKLYSKPRDITKWLSLICTDGANPMYYVNTMLYPTYACRMRIKQLADLFPKNTVEANCYSMDTAPEIQEMYNLIQHEVEMLKQKEESSGCYLARLTFARMKIEQLKIPTIINLAKDIIKRGESVAIFVNFTNTLEKLADQLNTNCVVYGEQSLMERDMNIQNFKTDKSHVIICNIRSGGVGISLHDTIGNRPRCSIISPSWSAQDILQCLGRIFRANTKTEVKQYILYCKDTEEEVVCENMKGKIINIAHLNDGENIEAYSINGLVGCDSQPIVKESEFDLLYKKYETLRFQEKRLQEELRKTQDELRSVTDKINNYQFN